MSLNSLQKCFQFNLKISLSITGSWVTYDFTKGAINGTGDYNTFGAPVVIRRFSSSPGFCSFTAHTVLPLHSKTHFLR